MFKANPTPPQAENVTPLRKTPPAPADPAVLLAKATTSPRTKWSAPKLLLLIGAGLVAAQVILPYPVKPAVVAGSIAASFTGQIMAESARQQLYISEQQEIAKAIGQQEAERATWHGNCALLGVIGAWQLETDCKSAVDQKFDAGADRARGAKLW